MDNSQSILWVWLLKYSSHLLTGIVSFLVSLLFYRITTKSASLYYYTSHLQVVPLTVPPAQQGGTPTRLLVSTFTLVIWNQGRAPARDVYVGHFNALPANNVFPDIPRTVENLPGGGQAIAFPVIPARTLINITYLPPNPLPVEQIVSYVGYEGGSAKHIPVMLQRIWPQPVLISIQVLMFLGLWVAINFVISLIGFLATVYYFR